MVCPPAQRPLENAFTPITAVVLNCFESIAYEEGMFYSITFPPQSHAIALPLGSLGD